MPLLEKESLKSLVIQRDEAASVLEEEETSMKDNAEAENELLKKSEFDLNKDFEGVKCAVNSECRSASIEKGASMSIGWRSFCILLMKRMWLMLEVRHHFKYMHFKGSRCTLIKMNFERFAQCFFLLLISKQTSNFV